MNSNRESTPLLLGETIPFCPPLPDTKTIFREMIAAEIRAGRLSAARRARIVRYASQIGLSAVETGRLIHDCVYEALEDRDPAVQACALRLAVQPPRRRLLSPHVSIVTGILLILIWLLR
jgi:hypothetical protein